MVFTVLQCVNNFTFTTMNILFLVYITSWSYVNPAESRVYPQSSKHYYCTTKMLMIIDWTWDGHIIWFMNISPSSSCGADKGGKERNLNSFSIASILSDRGLRYRTMLCCRMKPDQGGNLVHIWSPRHTCSLTTDVQVNSPLTHTAVLPNTVSECKEMFVT